MSKQMDFHPSCQEDELIFEVIQAVKTFGGLSEANQYFKAVCARNAEFAQLGNNVYHYKDYFINVGKAFLMAGHGRCIMDLTRLELSCLPQGIALIRLDNDEDMVLITRIKGSEKQRLIPYTAHNAALSLQARLRLLADADRLLADNRTILALTQGKKSWYILEDEGRIIFSLCEIAFVPENAKPVYRSRILEALDLTE